VLIRNTTTEKDKGINIKNQALPRLLNHTCGNSFVLLLIQPHRNKVKRCTSMHHMPGRVNKNGIAENRTKE
jgi:hypothetical protein